VPSEPVADLLEACLRAECDTPGASARIIQTAPPKFRRDLEQLVALGQALRHGSASVSLASPASPRAERRRIVARIAHRWWPSDGMREFGRHLTRLLRDMARRTVQRS
jgi:hypothetical protein